MQRRFRLGNEIIDPEGRASVKFNGDSELVIVLPICSLPVPSGDEPENLNSQRHTHRDILETDAQGALGSSLVASMYSLDESATVLNISMTLDSKVPGTGA